MKPFEGLTDKEKIELLKVHVIHNGATNTTVFMITLTLVAVMLPYTKVMVWLPVLLLVLSIPGLAMSYLAKNETTDKIRGK